MTYEIKTINKEIKRTNTEPALPILKYEQYKYHALESLIKYKLTLLQKIIRHNLPNLRRIHQLSLQPIPGLIPVQDTTST